MRTDALEQPGTHPLHAVEARRTAEGAAFLTVGDDALGEAVGLVTQLLEPVGGPLRQRRGTTWLVLLRQGGTAGQRQHREAEHDSAAEHLSRAEYSIAMRILALDMGRRRVGLAISDPSASLARPLMTLQVTEADLVDRIVEAVTRIAGEDDGLDEVVVGVPRHLDGTPSEETQFVQQRIAALRGRIALPVREQDERLTSREAESRLAVRERDWRKRKAQLDAAAAAGILQDFLDARQVG